MNKCKTCRHWNTTEVNYRIKELGSCHAVPCLFNATNWSGDDEIIMPKYAHTLAFVQDASDYSATLFTLPEFGCVMWEKKT